MELLADIPRHEMRSRLARMTPEQKAWLRHRLEEKRILDAKSDEERARLRYRAELEADLSKFMREAWKVLRPGIELDWSWHYDLMAEYLTLVYQRKIRRLIINVPPRTMKSLFCTVAFPAWVWTKQPTHSFVSASYAQNLSFEHSTLRRSLIQSEWFQSLWGDRVWLAKDQNEKEKYRNNHQAQMFATSVGSKSVTGMGGNTLILDDALNPQQAASEAERKTTHDWVDNTWRQRMNDQAKDAMIVVEQRTGPMDVTGYLLDQDKVLKQKGSQTEWVQLAIPLVNDEQQGKTTFVFPISGRKVERKIGDVLQPNRFPPDVVASLQIRRLIYGTQYQQRPVQLEGNMIKLDDIRYYGGRDPKTGELDIELPRKFDLIIGSTDCAFKDLATSDFVANLVVGVIGPRRYILEVTNNHLDEPATRQEIKRLKAKYNASTWLVEDKANGSAVIKSIKRTTSGILAVEPEGGKGARMAASCGEWQAGDWFVDRNASWVQDFIDQICGFPNVKHDDMADAMTQAAIYLQRTITSHGLTDYYGAEEERMRKEAENQRKRRENPNEIKLPTNTVVEVKPADGEVPFEGEKLAVDHPQQLTKPDVDDGTPRCPTCGSTALVRVGGAIRCNQCGTRHGGGMPIEAGEGQFRK